MVLGQLKTPSVVSLPTSKSVEKISSLRSGIAGRTKFIDGRGLPRNKFESVQVEFLNSVSFE